MIIVSKHHLFSKSIIWSDIQRYTNLPNSTVIKPSSKVTVAEVEMPSNPQSRQIFHDSFDFDEFDLYIVLTETWFKENIMWTVSQIKLKSNNATVRFVKTKVCDFFF